MKRVIAIMLLLAVGLGLLACAVTEESPAAESPAPTELTVTFSTSAPTMEPVTLVIELPTETAQSAAQTMVPTFTPEPTATPAPLAGKVIGLDPGHQQRYDPNPEPVAPGSLTTKQRVAGGTRGIVTRIYEYEVNLQVGLLLRDMLEEAGATVIMTRTVNDVCISNMERALLFNEHMVDLAVRLHCNGSDDHSKHGAFMLVPTEGRTDWYELNIEAALCIIRSYCKTTGLTMLAERDGGLTYRSEQTGFNWCKRPIVNIEMGHLTNSEDEAKLVDPEFQKLMAKGIYLGILEFFTGE